MATIEAVEITKLKIKNALFHYTLVHQNQRLH